MRNILFAFLFLILAVVLVYIWYKADYTAIYSLPSSTSRKPIPVVFVFPAMQGDAVSLRKDMIGDDAIIVRFAEPKTTFPTFGATLQKAEFQIATELEKLKEHYTIDTTKIICCGFSLGGDVAFALALRHVVPVTHVLIMGSRCTYRVQQIEPRVQQTRFAFLVGEKDERKQQHNEAINYLLANNCRVYRSTVPKIAHSVPNSDVIRQAFIQLSQSNN